uniref:Uncharacterized protein n=1 Tax=Parascaris univalens TaxID=6257 RepID=A0A915B5X9_PARUN
MFGVKLEALHDELSSEQFKDRQHKQTPCCAPQTMLLLCTEYTEVSLKVVEALCSVCEVHFRITFSTDYKGRKLITAPEQYLSEIFEMAANIQRSFSLPHIFESLIDHRSVMGDNQRQFEDVTSDEASNSKSRGTRKDRI